MQYKVSIVDSGVMICVASSSFPSFGFDLDIVRFILSFCCGYYAVSSVSVSAATRLAYDIIYQVYTETRANFQGYISEERYRR